MSDAEEPKAPAQEVVADDAAPANEAEDASKPKPRIKKPERPDDDAYRQKVEALTTQSEPNRRRPASASASSAAPPHPPARAVATHKARNEELKNLLDERRTGRSKGSAEAQAVKSKLAELRAQFQAVLVRARDALPAPDPRRAARAARRRGADRPPPGR
jgi:hypothetical protein